MTDTLLGSISVEEAGRRLGIGRSLTYEMLRQGVIPSIRLGKRFVIPEDRFERWRQDA